MHPALMMVPNDLFYDGFIQCEYHKDANKQFLYAHSPFLFIDVKDGVEAQKGFSFFNQREVEVISYFTKIMLMQFE